jgi:hypothetical protein
MSSLSVLSEEEKELVVGLPYRVGVFVSHADDEGGEEDDEKEMKALERILTSIAKQHQKSPFIKEVLEKTIEKKYNWQVWSEQSFNVTQDTEKTIRLLREKVDESDWKMYRGLLIRVGRTVAEAYGEFGEFEDEESSGFLSKVIDKISNKNDDLEDESHMNISAAEDAALSSLATAISSGSK